MPYLIHPHGARHPYALDDEDDHFLTYFSQWDWPYEHRPSDDPQIAQAIKRESKPRRPSLYTLWSKELRRRQEIADKRRALEAKGMYGSNRKLKVEEEDGGRRSLRKRVSSFFRLGRKGEEKGVDRAGYEDGVYVNHLEPIQRKWVEDDVEKQVRRHRSRLSLVEYRELLKSSPSVKSRHARRPGSAGPDISMSSDFA